MLVASGILPITPADSARAAAQVYSLSLLACIPLVVAGVAAVAWRHAPAGTRSLIWKSAVIALLIVYGGRTVPLHWLSWSVPGGLAAPLIALGRLQLAAGQPGAPASGSATGTLAAGSLVNALLMMYWAGVAVLLIPVMRSTLAHRVGRPRTRPLTDPEWARQLDGCCRRLGVRRPVRLEIADDDVVPQTWGIFRPKVLLPRAARSWNATERQAVLLHELAHVKRWDALFTVAARIACTLYWFHPGSWWVLHRLITESELACDDRVLAAGVRPSDYAELLIAVSAPAGPRLQPTVMAIAGTEGGLRGRLAAIVGPPRDLGAPSRGFAVVATVATLLVAAPTGTVRLAPTRGALTTLLGDVRWESRAYAAAGLAQRRDSVDVARAAARLDPSPRVRAMARYALAQPPGRDLPAILADQR